MHTVFYLVIGQPIEGYTLIQSAVPWEEHYKVQTPSHLSRSVNTSHTGFRSVLLSSIFCPNSELSCIFSLRSCLFSLITKLTPSHTSAFSLSLPQRILPWPLNRSKTTTVLSHCHCVPNDGIQNIYWYCANTGQQNMGLIRMDSGTTVEDSFCARN